MPVSRKSDAADIEAFLDALPDSFRLDSRQRRWAPYIYRFEDVTNVPLILTRGELLSRHRCNAEGVARLDFANEDIIAASQEAHPFVRLYWRPRTPMQYRVQGIRSPGQLEWPEAHCPVLTFLLFDAKRILTREVTQFTDGSLANRGMYRPGVGRDIGFLRQMPFGDIYGYGAFSVADRGLLVSRRHAEVLYPDHLDLDDLRWIVVRSGPIRDTLLDLLGADAAQWDSKIRVEAPGEALYDAHGSFVRDVWLGRGQLVIELLPTAGPFDVRLLVRESASSQVIVDRTTTVEALRMRHIAPLPVEPRSVHLRLWIGGNLAYSGLLTMRGLVTP